MIKLNELETVVIMRRSDASGEEQTNKRSDFVVIENFEKLDISYIMIWTLYVMLLLD